MKMCANCKSWAGGETDYMAACANADQYAKRTMFDHCCPLFSVRAGVNMQNQARGEQPNQMQSPSVYGCISICSHCHSAWVSTQNPVCRNCGKSIKP